MSSIIKKLYFAEGVAVDPPDDLAFSSLEVHPNDAAYEAVNGVGANGDFYINSTDKVIRYYQDGWRSVVGASDGTDATKRIVVDLSGNSTNVSATLDFNATANRVYTFPNATLTLVGEATAQTLTNKTIDADANTVTNIANAQIKAGAGIDATKIADGSVSNTEFQALDGVSSSIQTQLNSNASAISGHVGSTANPHSVTATQVGLGNVDNTSDATKNSATATLTNKTFGDAITMAHIATPANPAANFTKVYPKADGKLYKLDDLGNELEIGSGAGSGSGEINVIGSPSDAGDWTETGTVFDGGVATTTTAGDLPLAGVIDTALKLTADGNGARADHYVSYAWTMPEGLRNKKLKAEFYMRPGSGFVSSEWQVEVYAGSTRLPLSTDSTEISYLPNATGKYTTTFDSTDASSYTLRFSRTAGSGSAVLNVANVIVGPGIQPQGAVVTEWQSYTPTVQGAGTLSNVNAEYMRVGDSILLRGQFTAGTVPSMTEFRLGLPSGLTLLINPSSVNQAVGQLFRDVSGNANMNTLLARDGDTYLRVSFKDGSDRNRLAASDSDNIFATGNRVNWYTMPIRIAEWAGSGTVNLAGNDVIYLSHNGTGVVYGPSGSLVPNQLIGTAVNRDFAFPSAQNPNDWEVEYNRAGAGWAKVEGVFPFASQGTSTYGVAYQWTSSTNFRVTFSAQGALSNAGTYAGNSGTGWNDRFGAGDRFRIVRTIPGAATGFGLATPTQAGLVSKEASGTSTLSLTGISGTASGTVQWKQVGNLVTLQVPSITGGTSNTEGMSLSVIPVALRPTIGTKQIIQVMNNSALQAQPGLAWVFPDGFIYVYRTPNQANDFTMSGNKGVGEFTISYFI